MTPDSDVFLVITLAEHVYGFSRALNSLLVADIL